MMEVLIQEEKERYFLELALQGAKLLPHFNIVTIVTKEEEIKNNRLQKQIQSMQEELLQLMKDKEKPTKQFSLDNICPFPFDKGLFMAPFPKGVELPKYEKYLGTSDPQDHLREFGALSMEFIHDQTYLMCLFP